MPDRVIPPVRRPFRAMARTILPEVREMDEMGWQEAEAIIERGLRDRPPSVRRQLGLFIRVADLLPLLRYGRPFTGLSEARRAAYLGWLERAPVLLLRRGLWGVRTLVFMGYYGQPRVRAHIGYRASTGGWEARFPEGVPAPGDAPDPGDLPPPEDAP